MSETDDFSVINYKNKLFLILDSQEINAGHLYLPGCDSFGDLSGQIAVETDILKNEYKNDFTRDLKIDSGKIVLIGRSGYKINLNLKGAVINKTLVLIVPSWGRWTKKNIWVIVSDTDG